MKSVELAEIGKGFFENILPNRLQLMHHWVKNAFCSRLKALGFDHPLMTGVRVRRVRCKEVVRRAIISVYCLCKDLQE